MLYNRKCFLHHCMYLPTSIAKSCPKFGGGAAFSHIAPLLELYCHFSPEMKGTETTSLSTMSLIDSLYVGGVKIKAPNGLKPPLSTIRILIDNCISRKLTSDIPPGIFRQLCLAFRIRPYFFPSVRAQLRRSNQQDQLQRCRQDIVQSPLAGQIFPARAIDFPRNSSWLLSSGIR